MKALFITGTDTGVGKSIVSGLLGRYLSNKGYRVITQKWIQTGSRGFSKDVDLHLKLMNKERNDIKDNLSYVVPYNFKFASSPHLAAALEKRKIDVKRIEKSFIFLKNRFDFVIVEGVGGALVPINEKRLIIDIAKKMELATLLVIENRLGAINHTLLTIEAIKRRGIELIGIIFNNKSAKAAKIIFNDNIKIIKKLTDETVLGILPYLENKELLYKAFIPIGKKILSLL